MINMLSLSKKIFCIFLIIMITIMSTAQSEILGAVDYRKSISSFGSITYTAVSLPPQIPNSTSSLPIQDLLLTGIGADYTLHYSDQDAEIWIREGKVSLLEEWKTRGYSNVRLGFVFPGSTGMSILDYIKFDRVIEIISSTGVKVIPHFQNNRPDCPSYGQTTWNNWLYFAQYYKDDDRISALSLFCEPFKSTRPDDVTNLQQTQYFADLIRAIHEIDPDRMVIFPTGQTYYSSQQRWLADLEITGILSESHVVFDINHPYFFENDYDMGMTPEQKAVWYMDTWVIPAINVLGAERCWSGETFAWVTDTYTTVNTPSHLPTYDLQVRWLTSIINQHVKYGVGFQIWDLITWHPNSWHYKWNLEGALGSNYGQFG